MKRTALTGHRFPSFSLVRLHTGSMVCLVAAGLLAGGIPARAASRHVQHLVVHAPSRNLLRITSRFLKDNRHHDLRDRASMVGDTDSINHILTKFVSPPSAWDRKSGKGGLNTYYRFSYTGKLMAVRQSYKQYVTLAPAMVKRVRKAAMTPLDVSRYTITKDRNQNITALFLNGSSVTFHVFRGAGETVLCYQFTTVSYQGHDRAYMTSSSDTIYLPAEKEITALLMTGQPVRGMYQVVRIDMRLN